MTPLDKLDVEIKNARRVVWPANQNDVVNKLVFCLATHVKELYKEIANLKEEINESKAEECSPACAPTDCESRSEEGGAKEETKAAKDKDEAIMKEHLDNMRKIKLLKATKRKAPKRKKKAVKK